VATHQEPARDQPHQTAATSDASLTSDDARPTHEPAGSALEVLGAFTRLGLTSFGGPIAHLGYFREEIVNRRRWIDDESYADIVALCQFLPGPASSQVGISLGLIRAGVRGALAAWIGFTLPSAIALGAFAFGVTEIGGAMDAGWLHGLKIVAVAVVAQAVWGMATTLCPDRERATIAILAAVAVLLWFTAAGQVLTIVIAGLIGWRFLPHVKTLPPRPLAIPIGRRTAIVCLTLFFGLLVGLPLLHQATPSQPLAIFDGFYRAGSLVFGGGHVVLPLLQTEVVAPGWVTNEEFVAGYGAAQAVPGPLFTFSAYLGVMIDGLSGGILALVAIFLPSFFLVFGALPFWDALRVRTGFQSALRGINAAVVGILLAALYDPVFTSAIMAPENFALALIAFGLLVFWKLPPWLVVLLAALGGIGLGYI
jgi:chromate transporter